MQLNQINEQVYYIDAAVNIGVIVNERREALVVDAGIDESAGKKIIKLLTASDMKPTGLLITHAHADHYGGAAGMAKQCGLRIYASDFERTVLEHPIWEPYYLSHGAAPEKALENKFFMGQPVQVDQIVECDAMSIDGWNAQTVDLSGHSPGQIGVTANGVLFCADAVISQETITKHGIPLNADLEKTLASYERLLSRQEKLYIPSHGDPTADILRLVHVNRQVADHVIEQILTTARVPRSMESIIQHLCPLHGININNPGTAALVRLTVGAYLSYLTNRNLLRHQYQENVEQWVVSDAAAEKE